MKKHLMIGLFALAGFVCMSFLNSSVSAESVKERLERLRLEETEGHGQSWETDSEEESDVEETAQNKYTLSVDALMNRIQHVMDQANAIENGLDLGADTEHSGSLQEWLIWVRDEINRNYNKENVKEAIRLLEEKKGPLPYKIDLD